MKKLKNGNLIKKMEEDYDQYYQFFIIFIGTEDKSAFNEVVHTLAEGLDLTEKDYTISTYEETASEKENEKQIQQIAKDGINYKVTFVQTKNFIKFITLPNGTMNRNIKENVRLDIQQQQVSLFEKNEYGKIPFCKKVYIFNLPTVIPKDDDESFLSWQLLKIIEDIDYQKTSAINIGEINYFKEFAKYMKESFG